MILARALALGLACAGLAGGSAWLDPVRAYDHKSGMLWLRKCTSPEADGQIECAIYVRALVEYDELRARVLGEKRAFCVAKGATLGETHRVVVDFLRDHRQDLEEPFALLAHRALSERYPCPGGAPPPAGAATPDGK
jgi:hypothetical protein